MKSGRSAGGDISLVVVLSRPIPITAYRLIDRDRDRDNWRDNDTYYYLAPAFSDRCIISSSQLTLQ
jgi:hypothetical protein